MSQYSPFVNRIIENSQKYFDKSHLGVYNTDKEEWFPMNVVSIEKFFYGRKEAAQALGVSVRSIDYLISEQKLRTYPFKRRRLIPTEDVKRVAAEILSDKMVG